MFTYVMRAYDSTEDQHEKTCDKQHAEYDIAEHLRVHLVVHFFSCDDAKDEKWKHPSPRGEGWFVKIPPNEVGSDEDRVQRGPKQT